MGSRPPGRCLAYCEPSAGRCVGCCVGAGLICVGLDHTYQQMHSCHTSPTPGFPPSEQLPHLSHAAPQGTHLERAAVVDTGCVVRRLHNLVEDGERRVLLHQFVQQRHRKRMERRRLDLHEAVGLVVLLNFVADGSAGGAAAGRGRGARARGPGAWQVALLQVGDGRRREQRGALVRRTGSSVVPARLPDSNHARTHARTHARMHAAHACTHTHTHTHIHTHSHTHTLAASLEDCRRDRERVAPAADVVEEEELDILACLKAFVKEALCMQPRRTHLQLQAPRVDQKLCRGAYGQGKGHGRAH
eukprot:217551-Chlamydomonas_euryale.AAC.3